MLWICFFDKKHQTHPEKRDAARIELTSPKLGILTYTNMCRCFLCVAVFLFAQLGDGFADKRGGRAGKKITEDRIAPTHCGMHMEIF